MPPLVAAPCALNFVRFATGTWSVEVSVSASAEAVEEAFLFLAAPRDNTDLLASLPEDEALDWGAAAGACRYICFCALPSSTWDT